MGHSGSDCEKVIKLSMECEMTNLFRKLWSHRNHLQELSHFNDKYSLQKRLPFESIRKFASQLGET
jgi:hypothetical protein